MTWGDRDAWADFAADRAVGQVREKKPRKKPSEEEHQIQSAFIDWVRLCESMVPELGLIYAIPNGGWRNRVVAAKLKAEGVKPGVPDLHLPVARGPWHSLYLETKAPGKDQRPEQKELAWKLMKAGNLVKVCHSVDDLIRETEEYLARPKPPKTYEEVRAA